MPKMVYVSGDMLALIAEVATRRVAMVCGKMAGKNGGELRLDDREAEELKWMRRLHHRMMRGDYRMDENEWHRLRDLCNWLARRHAENYSQPEPGVITWSETALWATEPPEPGTYQDLVGCIATGQLDGATGGGDE